jgi:hypothetical protein
MIATLFAAFLFAQTSGGAISGIVRDAAGNPVTGIRVALMSEPNVLANIGKTEASGYYRLENIPPGRYYVVAGRVDTPTYYPGTLDLKMAQTILVTVGSSSVDLNFGILPQSLQPVAGERGYVNLALFTSNVRDLLQRLPGSLVTSTASTPFTFTLDRLVGTRLFFTSESGSSLSAECEGCSVVVARHSVSSLPTGTNAVPSGPGIEFRVKDGGKEVEFVCRAGRCALGVSNGGTAFKPGETGTIPASGSVLFHVVP